MKRKGRKTEGKTKKRILFFSKQRLILKEKQKEKGFLF